MTEPFKLVDLMPAVAAKLEADEAHRRECKDSQCVRCGRVEMHRAARAVNTMFLETGRADVLKWIPPTYAAASLDAEWLMALVGPANITRCPEVIREQHIAFVGPPGAGKTSLAAAMYRVAVAGETSTGALSRYRWVSAHKLAKARSQQPMGEGESPLVEACINASLLVLDELGAEDLRYASAVAEVLFERHDQARPTWVTTGVGPQEIAKRYGGGIARRVFEGAVVFRLGKT